MTLATSPASQAGPGVPDIPTLRTGDHLTQAEFHRRYEAMGEGVRAELIEGMGIPATAGGRTKLVKEGNKRYVEGAPEFIAEIAASTASIDLNAKLRAYQRNGLREYPVVLTEEQRDVRWMQLIDDRFEPVAPDADGPLKSRVFPGL